MIKLLHFADLHLGMENYGRIDAETGMSSRIRDFIRRLDEIVDYSRENRADLVIFAGDAFKNRQPNPTIQREFAWRIRDMAELCPVVLLIGNHDLPTHAQRASSLEIYSTLGVPNVLVGDKYELYTVQTSGGPALVATAPYPLRTQLLTDEQTHGKTISEIDEQLQRSLQKELDRLANLAFETEPHDAPRVLVGHFGVSGAVLGSEQSVMIGRDAMVGPGELDNAAWDYVALGHIHKYQNLTAGRKGAPPVVYSGSLERIDFGEEGEPKGFCWVELERGRTRYTFVPVKCRPFVTLRVDTRAAPDPLARVLSAIQDAALQDAVVRLIIQADADNLPPDKPIHEALREAGVSVVASIKKEIDRTARSRLGANPEELTTLQLLERYFVAKETPPERIKTLLDRARDLLSE